MTIRRMEHIGIVVDDLDAAIAFFRELGLVLEGEGQVDGDWVERIVGLEEVRVEVAMLRTPNGEGRLELARFVSPAHLGAAAKAPANAPGLRHVAFSVAGIDDVVARLQVHGGDLVGSIERYRDAYRLCYVRGPAGVIIELVEQLE
jgi:catechol 2,3-dioxygenase-like lactoylglutathione lyase family enzyme